MRVFVPRHRGVAGRSVVKQCSPGVSLPRLMFTGCDDDPRLSSLANCFDGCQGGNVVGVSSW